MALLELKNFCCGYGEMAGVRDLSVAVEQGQILAMMGHVQMLVEQNTARARDVAHQVCVPASGRSVFTGWAESARRDVDLPHSYTRVAA